MFQCADTLTAAPDAADAWNLDLCHLDITHSTAYTEIPAYAMPPNRSTKKCCPK